MGRNGYSDEHDALAEVAFDLFGVVQAGYVGVLLTFGHVEPGVRGDRIVIRIVDLIGISVSQRGACSRRRDS